MSEAKYTKGPWKWDGVDPERLVAFDDSTEAILFASTDNVSIKNDADKQLIAAAPDLLEALVAIRKADKEALEELKALVPELSGPTDEAVKLWEMADKAINKATGES